MGKLKERVPPVTRLLRLRDQTTLLQALQNQSFANALSVDAQLIRPHLPHQLISQNDSCQNNISPFRVQPWDVQAFFVCFTRQHGQQVNDLGMQNFVAMHRFILFSTHCHDHAADVRHGSPGTNQTSGRQAGSNLRFLQSFTDILAQFLQVRVADRTTMEEFLCQKNCPQFQRSDCFCMMTSRKNNLNATTTDVSHSITLLRHRKVMMHTQGSQLGFF